ncbi:hypothetical protein C7N43_32840 [Sphingobacteriales bacterium UPWRP_1]|nr:hypothetical protein B6N25_09135 [Sphingobacteriales bacterium TSM_CSS]PSJ72710.1 hypothetical protein C7N43_32840 [Sphingobacteriales bacterium UPWRP_1]
MEEILKTTLLEYEKSAFLIDLIRHNNGKEYIRILQTIYEEETKYKRIININPSLLMDIVRVLNEYAELVSDMKTNHNQAERNNIAPLNAYKYMDEIQKKTIIHRYLNGVSISDLTIQFNCSEELITQILYNNGIVIVNEKPPVKKKFKNYRKRK